MKRHFHIIGILLRSRRCDTIVYAPTGINLMIQKPAFSRNYQRVFDIFPKYHIKTMLRDFNANVKKSSDRQFRTRMYASTSDNSCVRVAEFATPKI